MTQSTQSQTSTNVSALGLSKDLKASLTVKLCYLQPTNNSIVLKKLAKPSDKYSNPQVFKRLSNIYFNSDMLVKIEVMSGSTHKPVTLPCHSPYHSFTNNKRVWNKYLKLPVNYNQLSIDSYLKFTLYEISDSKQVVYGVGYLSSFNHSDSTLRKGMQKIPIRTEYDDVTINYHDADDMNDGESNLIKYENGDFAKVDWLDKFSLPFVEKARNDELKTGTGSDLFYLYIELPRFDLPIVYSETSYELPDTKAIIEEFKVNKNNLNENNITNTVVNQIDISGPTKVFDPDFHLMSLGSLVSASQQTNNANHQGYVLNWNNLDPIESKYHKLERNMNNSSLLDKELKPTPQLRDELLKILDKPSNIELSEIEKNLIWKFRYYFSKNNSTNSNSDNKPEVSKINQKFLTKFLKSINWDNDYELDHTFNEMIPYYWSVDKIQIGDALDLLSSYFNPFTLASNVTVPTPKKDGNSKETKSEKIFKYVRQLRNFAVDRLRLASQDELLLYLLQLVQALKYETIIADTELNAIINDEEVVSHSNGMDDDVHVNSTISNKEAELRLLEKSPLASFLIEKAVGNDILGNFFYWYVKVENEDQLNTNGKGSVKIYSIVLNKYIEELKSFAHKNKLPNYNYLKRQVWFIKKLTGLVELLRTTFKKNEATAKKIQFLRDHLADSSNEFLKFPHSFPLPLDPSIIICGCYPEESSVFKSSLSPLKLTFKTVIKDSSGSGNQIFGDRKKYGKYTLMFKIGDDLRQDQLVIQIINLMDQLLKNENLDLKLTPYRILATSPIAGMIQFVANETLDSILVKNYGPESSGPNSINMNNGILNFLRYHSKELQQADPIATSVLGNPKHPPAEDRHAITSDLGVSSVVMDNYVKSCAGYCVITYLLGVGDRHLDNLLLSPNGKFWHADFGYILGRDPKPFPPLMKLPIQVIDGMGGLSHENFNVFNNYCFVTYTTLRKNSNLILNLFQLMLDANIPDIKMDPTRAVEKVQEKFCLEMTEEEAILHFQNLINDSVNAFLPVVIDRLHSLAQYWRA
ncbi:Phosphatidylinositol (PI) 3-kinase [Yamadazyma tenuis]|uniref:Phosphatidylinositol 3-kinase VPS34 n=1 Tax=Candida tenuis (strain ATCC 10573 / BCRC 21748 / CBS 615 / JCM 9827 / NBRC 10315 / NRRL Y-1498 / VKM Y-70) TaxID=590646 RepID=G3B9G2_CANTC|nr:phosphatidylinositol 3-kinase [Yamadazyma tenuis ATCC 10573]EGV61879.1 phosphatidylinositol 3-kinase [Yamadazyma tenuis ATCC 10573]WEJ93109.1 Phosphatidylinositol (PI) 3-kinase [Yamadazyma tenuis]